MMVLAILLILSGLLQLWAGVAAMLRKGEFKTTQARQLASVLGRQGTVAFFLILGAILTGGGLFLLVRTMT
ncbi:MAG TPA: hypothetical protein VLM85_14440 [Polyangiaceae bacterium]|nr:hypothetical protein [Polyangiaceae bacterium]